MRTILRVCRDYGQRPEWWDGLDRGQQNMLLADHRIRLTEGSHR